MKKTGFTLVELLAVLTIFGILCILAIPPILNQVKNNQKEISKTQENIIFHAVYLYLEDTITANSTYCVKIQDLLDADLLEDPVQDLETGKILSPDRVVKAKTNNKKKLSYELLKTGDSCTPETGEPTPIPTPNFATDSWDTIAKTVKENPGAYPVGAEKEVTLTGTYAGTYTVRVANNTTPSECSNDDFSESACGFVVEFADIITKKTMNSTATNKDGWPKSQMYTIVNTNIYNALPEDLKKVIKNTKVVSSHGSEDSSNFISTDKLYLLATKEIWGKEGASKIIGNDSSDNQTRQLDYYKKENITTSNYERAKKQYQGSNIYWWTRSSRSDYSRSFYSVTSDGDWNSYSANETIGVAPAFRVG